MTSWPNVPLHLGSQGKQDVCVNTLTRATHMHVIGSSGRGKSKHLEYLVRQDINAGHGLCVIDPHGGIVENIIQWAAFHQRRNHRKIMVIELANEDWRFGFNPLADDGYTTKEVKAEEMMGIISAVWGDEDSNKTARLEKWATNVFYACAELELSMADAQTFVDPSDPDKLRRYAGENLQNPYYKDQISRLVAIAKTPSRFLDWTESTESRFARLLRSSQVRESLSLVEGTIDFRAAMEEGHVILVNLQPRGKLSAKSGHAFGRMLIRDLVNVALSRDKEFPEARPFYLYCDECYHLLGDDTETMLDETRKYGLHTILSHQRLGQLGEPDGSLYNAVMNGAQTKAVFGVLDPRDATTLAQYLYMDEFDPNMVKQVLSKEQAVGTRKTELHGWSESDTDGVASIPEVTTHSVGTSEIPGAVISGLSESFGAEGDFTGSVETTTTGEPSFVYTENESTTPAYDIHSSSHTSSRSGAEAFETLYAIRATSTVPVDEQLLQAAQMLRKQAKQEVTVKIVEKAPKTLKVPTVELPTPHPGVEKKFRQSLLENTSFAHTTSNAKEMIRQHRAKMLARIEGRLSPGLDSFKEPLDSSSKVIDADDWKETFELPSKE